MKTLPPFQYADLEIRFSEGTHNLGKVKNRTLPFGKFIDMLRKPVRDNVTHAQYLKLPKEEQDRRKNPGFWLGGHSKTGQRATRAIVDRDTITLDIDAGTPELLRALKIGDTKLSPYCFVLHTTRKHTPESPRYRIVIPLSAPLPTEGYTAASRLTAQMVDESMDSVDDVSFRPAQMMYKPTVSSDGEYIVFQNTGELLDANAMLEEFGDWHDYTKLPYSERQGQKRDVDPNRKAEDPTTKKGIVGAFCRAYDVPSAIDAFLSDVYAPGDAESGKPRYTFLGGTASNGAVIEDGGLFLYSHHTSDPCSDMLVNAFDLVRIHKFGHLDEDGEDGSPSELPSYKALEEFLEDDKLTVQQVIADRLDVTAMFEDLGDDPDAPETDDEPDDELLYLIGHNGSPTIDDDLLDLIGTPSAGTQKEKAALDTSWLERLEATAKGGIKANLTNIALICQNDPRITPSIQLNDFTGEVVTRKPLRTKVETVPVLPVADRVNGDLWTDMHDTAVRMLLEAPAGPDKPGYGLKVSDRDLKAAIEATAAMNRFHPVRDYLGGLSWDGRPRVDRLMIDYLGATNNAYSEAVSRLFCIAAVARVHEPGHKFDFTPILEGLQGKRKSTFIKVLAKNWFNELQGDFHDRRKLVESMQGAWINEIPELSAFSRSEVNETKAFISATEDKTRLAYARRATVFKRQCVFMGSTNENAYLQDQTGNRRFWPLACHTHEIDTDRLAREVDQIWAEAVVLYRAMRAKQPKGDLPLYLTGAAEAIAVQEQAGRRVQTDVDALAGKVGYWLDEPAPESVVNGTASRFKDLDAFGQEPMLVRDSVCQLEVWTRGLGRTEESYRRAESILVSNIMRFLGWVCDATNTRTAFGSQRLWRRPKGA